MGPMTEAEIAETCKRIHLDANDLDAWSVYSDYLIEEGDIRGELIALELCGGSDRVDEIYAKYKKEWMGEEFFNLYQKIKANVKGDLERVFKIEWMGGFITSLKMGETSSYYSSYFRPYGETIAMMLESEASKHMSELTIGVIFNGTSHGDYRQFLFDLPKSISRRSLTKVYFGDLEDNNKDVSYSHLGRAAHLLRIFPNLTELTLHGGWIDLYKVELHKLRKLIMESGGIQDETLLRVSQENMPELEELEIWLGENRYEELPDIFLLDALLNSGNKPALRKLALKYSPSADKLIELLLESKIISQLKELDFSLGKMSDSGVDQIINNHEKFHQFSSINLQGNPLTEDRVAQLKSVLKNTEIQF